MGKYSFIGDLVKDSSKAAKEVIENGGGSANQRAKMIKNCVNNVQSNLGKGQARAVSEMGGDSGRALKEGIQTALNQTQANTAQNALNRTARQGNSAVQKSKEFIDKKRVNQVIDGHNAKQRDVEMQTIVNNVKDRNINRVPKDHETAKNAVNKANETVRNARNTQNQNTATNIFNAEYGNNWRENSFHGKPVVGYNRDNYQMHTQNTGSQASPFLVNNRKLQNEVEFYENRRTQTDTWRGPTKERAERMNTTGDNTGGNAQSDKNTFDKAKQRLNRTFEKVPESVKDTFIGGISDSYKGIQDGQGIFEAIGNAHKNDDGSINWRRAAGTFMTASAAARVASGGGAYKDRYGNPNLIGVPFI